MNMSPATYFILSRVLEKQSCYLILTRPWIKGSSRPCSTVHDFPPTTPNRLAGPCLGPAELATFHLSLNGSANPADFGMRVRLPVTICGSIGCLPLAASRIVFRLRRAQCLFAVHPKLWQWQAMAMAMAIFFSLLYPRQILFPKRFIVTHLLELARGHGHLDLQSTEMTGGTPTRGSTPGAT